MIKKVAVLTSGGDAPGMNACVRSVVRAGIKAGLEMYVIHEGYRGLVEGNIEKVDRNYVSDIINRGGTILCSARLKSFVEREVQKIAVEQLKKHGIDGLVVIGGDGTYRGAKALSSFGVKTVGIPATIDNDVASTDYSIGFDTCLNTICECVDKIRDTTTSHKRCTIIEVMGNKCGDLALYSGIAEGVEMIVTPDHPFTVEQICEKLTLLQNGKKKHALIVVSEKVFDNLYDVAKQIEEKTDITTRCQILGHIQRGGSPSARDRIEASRFGVAAIDRIVEGKTGICLGLKNDEIVEYDIDVAVNMPRKTHEELLKVIKTINR